MSETPFLFDETGTTEDEREAARDRLLQDQLSGLTVPAETTGVNTGELQASGALEQTTRDDVDVPLRELGHRAVDLGRRSAGALVRGANNLIHSGNQLNQQMNDWILDRIGDPEDENSFVGWLSRVGGPERDDEGNLAKPISDERIDDVFGVEGESPYLTSSLFEGAFKAIPAYAAVTIATGGSGALAQAGIATFTRAGLLQAGKRIGLEGVRGAVADAITWDRYEERVADMLAGTDIPLASALGEMLATDADDSFAVAKLKQAAEGFITGAAIDAFINTGRGFREWKRLKRMRRAGVDVGDLEEQAEVVIKRLEEARDVKANERFAVKPHEDGFEVVIRESGDTAPGQRALYRTVEEADGVASRMNLVDAGRSGLGSALEGSQITAARLLGRELATAGTDDLQRIFQKYRQRINYSQDYVGGPGTTSVARLRESSGVIRKGRASASPTGGRARVQRGTVSPERTQLLENIAQHMPTEGKDILKLARTVADGLFEGIGVEEVLDKLAKRFPNQNPNAMIFAAKNLFDGVGAEVDRLARVSQAFPDDPTIAQELGKALTYLQDVSDDFLGAASRPPRNTGRIKVKGITAPAGSPRVFEGLTKREVGLLSRRIAATEGNSRGMLVELRLAAEEAAGVIKRPRDPSLMSKAAEIRVNGMVSSILTTTTNILSGSMNMVFDPLARITAGISRQNTQLMEEGVDLLVGNMRSVFDAFGAWRKAYRAGDSILGTLGQSNIGRAFKTGMPVRDLGGVAAGELQDRAVPGMWGAFFNVPRKFLVGGDEIVKTIAGRSWVRAQALKSARANVDIQKLPRKQRAKAMHDQVERELADHVNDTGQFTQLTGAQDYARDITFTQTLGAGTMGGDFAAMMNKHPWMRLIHPFHRISVNLFRKSWAMTPGLARLQKGVADDLAAGGTRAALAQGRIELGGAVWAMGGYLAVSGAVTGGGPRNAVLREQWEEADNHPYHLTVPGTRTQIDLRRFYPFSAPLMMAADFVEMSDYMDEGQLQQIPLTVMASVANSVTSPTFLNGITDFMDALRGDEASLSHFARSFVASSVPFSSFLKGVNPDEVMRETQSELAGMIDQLPIVSGMLEPDRNMLGQPVIRPPGFLNRVLNPAQPKPAAGERNPLLAELYEIGRSLPKFEPMRPGNINMQDRDSWRGSGQFRSSRPARQSPYDRLYELQASTEIGGVSMEQQLQQIVDNPAWEKLSSGTSDHPGGARWKIIANIMETRLDAALSIVLSEYPLLNMEIERQKAITSAADGGQEMVDTLDEMFDHIHQLPPSRR